MRYIIAIIAVILSSSCTCDHKPTHVPFIFKNETDSYVYLFWSRSDKIDTLHPLDSEPIAKMNGETFFGINNKFIEEFDSISHKKVRLYIVKQSDVEKYGMNKILHDTIYAKKFILNEDSLEKRGWTITYTGK
jgi:hypothetical protein